MASGSGENTPLIMACHSGIGYFLNGQYTVVGKVTSGMEIVDKIKRGEGPNGSVLGEPDKMVSVVASD